MAALAIKAAPAHIGISSARLLCRVKGNGPLAWRPTRYASGRPTKNPIPTQSRTRRNTSAHAGAVENRNLRQVSAGAPVIAQMGGKSPAVSWDAKIRTRFG